jgi:hypothetical protein
LQISVATDAPVVVLTKKSVAGQFEIDSPERQEIEQRGCDGQYPDEQRSGKGSHRQFIHPTTGHVITVAVHTKKEVGTGLANRILKEAGLK